MEKNEEKRSVKIKGDYYVINIVEIIFFYSTKVELIFLIIQI